MQGDSSAVQAVPVVLPSFSWHSIRMVGNWKEGQEEERKGARFYEA